MDAGQAYSADRSLKGKLRRRLSRWIARRPARVRLERPMVSFTFDDAPATAFETGAALLEAVGARGTFYVSAGLAGTDGPMGPIARREAVERAMAAGHDIACHTFSHLDCGRATAAEIADDAGRSRATLVEWGAPAAATFAYPYGDVSPRAKRVLAGRYGLLRGLHHGLIEDGVDLNQAPAVGVEGADGEAVAARWIETAAARRGWLILYTHDVCETPSAWGCTPAALARLIAAASARGLDIVTAAEGLRRIAA
ncbi:polysaccharide deacetylase [Caulobacter sp. CCUG 60055]|uniref:polysaccharide deacetylase family protein n=1 Tax=Caulobacter sp. CCUG 60055 TaxID=2100090 RepID=UPI001FA782CF|nr:polysaccharide deacetylase family protein [Caulobacter sp. CCUG 60055]MBQ1541007.1 polysaccharide deacetylase family protein [Caulobacteraceae bacterium]MCI3179087.1 polysaccharide deacetylase [Caulobacter sp. CCUG 60055]